jgi:N-acetylglucosamine-6-phosphate deacetylase
VTEARLGVSVAYDGERLVAGDVAIANGRVAGLGLQPPVGDLLAAPGFVDLQVNGYAGVDLQSASVGDVVRVGEALLEAGVTAYQPTLISAPPASTERALAVLHVAAAVTGGARVLPAHLEGPFLSERWPGAHPPEQLRAPDLRLVERLLAAGPVGYVTLAPELPGGLDLVAQLVERGIVVAIGHSDATAEEAHAAFDAGARAITHAFNAHRGFAGREPGPAGAALARDDVWVTVIADGVHVSPDVVQLVHRAVGDRLVAVTDCMTAAGAEDGDYAFGPLTVRVSEGRATLADGRLAGSAATLDRCLRELVAAGVPLENALAAVTSRPAALLGRPELGRLRTGDAADLVVLDRALSPMRTLVGGRTMYDRARVGAGSRG